VSNRIGGGSQIHRPSSCQSENVLVGLWSGGLSIANCWLISLRAMTNGRMSEADPSRWRVWVLSSSASLVIDRILMRSEAVAISIAIYFILFDELTHRPALGSPILVVLGILLIAVGQVWTIVLLHARFPPRRTGKSETLFRLGLVADDRRGEYFLQLTAPQKLTLLALTALGFASVATASSSMDTVSASSQRFFVSIMALFLLEQFAVILNEKGMRKGAQLP
jgi:hypothetical protein